MCEFFSFNTIQGKVFYFKPKDIKEIRKQNNPKGLNFNSHTSIAEYYKFNEDKSNKYEYNPFTQEFKVDQINTKDDSKFARQWVKKLFKFKTRKQFLTFCRNYFYKIDYKQIEEDLKNVPTKNDAIKLLKIIENIDWFKPQTPNKQEIKRKVKTVITAFNLNFGFEFELHKLNNKEDWDSARDSAWASAWDSAWDSAWASARDSAWASARDSARDSAWDSAWASAWASAWDSARASARDSARASGLEVVKDLMKQKGYNKNPFRELLRLWEMGLYPVGILKDKKFHIYYVPRRRSK